MSRDAMVFVVDASHPCLPGHFPGRPVVPGVVILDHVLAAIESTHGATGRLRLPQVKFMQPLLPGEAAAVALDAVPPHDGESARWRFRVERGACLLATGDVAVLP